MTEAKLSTRIQKLLPAIHWQRIENSVGVGCPDLNGCWKGKEFWIELKIIGGAPIRASQKVWHMRRNEAAGKAFIFHYHPKKEHITVVYFHCDLEWATYDDFPLTKNNLAMWVASL